MQFWKRIPIIIMATIILTVACQNHSSKTTFPTLFSTPQNGTGEDNPVSGLDLARFEEISRVLSMSEKGQSALQLVEAYQIRVRFEPGNGSRFIPNRNEIVIDSRAGKFSAALTMVHEVTHARYYHKGLTADINLLNRQVYTQMKIEEEMMAVIDRIEATKQLSESGVIVANLRHVLYYPYRQAYGAAVRAAKVDYPGSDEDTLQNIGRAAGQTAVRQALLHDQVLTSTTEQSYVAYWGSIWDQNIRG
jgi:hypothetical protein